MSASNVKAGGVFVEIGADPRQFFATLNKVNRAMANMGRSLSGAGTKMAGVGIGALAGFGVAVNQGAAFENVLLSIQAASSEAAGRMGEINKAAMDMSAALGRGPAAVADAMLQLVKAGMSVDDVLGGAGKAAIQFASVGQLEVGQAAEVMSDAMNVFSVSASKAVDSLSSAADSSSVSIGQMVEAFANVGAIGKDANQTIDDMSAAIAILGNNMVKGGDAGTALKTMLLRLSAGADGAAEGMAMVGLSMESFRDAKGNFLPIADAMDVLAQQIKALDPLARDAALYKIFGAYGLKAAKILLKEGTDGFAKMREAMSGADSVAKKFDTQMSGITGATERVTAALDRTAVAVSDAVAPAFVDLAKSLEGSLNWLSSFARDNPQVVQSMARSAASAVTFGGALIGLGSSLRIVSFAFGGFMQAGKMIASPFLVASSTAQSLGKSLALVGVQIATFSSRGIAALSQFAAEATARLAMSAARSGAIATNYFAGTISIMSATIARAAEGNFRAAAIGVQAMARLGATGATAVLAIAGPATQAAGAVLTIGSSAGKATTALALTGTTATATGALTLASIGKSIAAITAYTSLSLSSAAATAAAWAAANVPLLALVGIIGGAIFAFSQLFKVAAELGGWMREGFNGAVSDTVTVFMDMKRIALDTFAAITDAMAAGDMALAMKAAMLGLQAEFQRGANGILSKTSEFSANLLNVIDAYTTSLRQPFILTSSMDPEVERERRALRQRQADRLTNAQAPGQGGEALAALENKLGNVIAEAAGKRADKELADAASERLATAKTAADVDLARQQIAGLLDRGTLTAEAEQRLADEFNKRWDEMSRGPAAAVTAAMAGGTATNGPAGLSAEAYTLGVGINAAGDLKELGRLGKQISDLIEGDVLSSEQEQYLLNAYRDAQNRIANQSGMGIPQSQAEVAGTFSSVGLGGLGFGGSLVQKIAEYGKRTAEATEQMANEGAEVQA